MNHGVRNRKTVYHRRHGAPPPDRRRRNIAQHTIRQGRVVKSRQTKAAIRWRRPPWSKIGCSARIFECEQRAKHPIFDHGGRRHPMDASVSLVLTTRPCRIVCWAMFVCLGVAGGAPWWRWYTVFRFRTPWSCELHARREVYIRKVLRIFQVKPREGVLFLR